MDLSNFLNPVEEDIETIEEIIRETTGEDLLLEQVIAQYIPDSEAQDDDDEDEELNPQPVLTPQAAHEAIQRLIEFTESGNSGTKEAAVYLRSFEQFERELGLTVANSKAQGTLDSWFM
jgi:hypothetical protein